MTGNGWDEWGKHVLEEQKRQGEALEKITSGLEAFKIEIVKEIAKLKIKSGIWGALAGALPVTIALVAWLIRS